MDTGRPAAPVRDHHKVLTRHHATAFLAADGSRAIEELRLTWDPRMARQIAGHVTLIYPEEIPDAAELAARAAGAAVCTPPFTIATESPFYRGSPAAGVFLAVADIDDGIRAFRAAAIPSGAAVDFPPHVTIVHPRTSALGDQAWAELASAPIQARFTISKIAITAHDGGRWQSLQVIPLTGRGH
jgi:2'-5' RNA ligase